MQTLVINKFYGGMSDTDAYTSDAMSAYQENVDGMSQPEVLKLNRKVQTEFTTEDGLVTAQIDEYYYADNGKVYNSAGVVQYTLPSGVFYNAIKFGTYFIGFYVDGGKLKLSQTPTTALGAPIWGSTVAPFGINPDLTPFEPALNNHFYCVAVNDSEDVLYFIGKNIVYSVLISQLPLISPAIVFEDNVVGITRQGQQISIYLQNGRKYFWDGFSEQHDGYVDLGLMIRYVFSTRNYDYVIAGNAAAIYSKLFISQGQSFQLIRSGQFTLDAGIEKRRHAYGMSTPYGNASMASSEKQIFIANSWQFALESYGNKTPGLPQGTVVEAQNDLWQEIGAIWFEDLPDVVFMSVRDPNLNASVVSIPFFRTPTPKYQAVGTYYTKKYVMGALKVRQPLLVMRKNTPTDTQIQVYVAVNGSSTYQLLKTITGPEDQIKIASPDIIKLGYEFQYKIVLSTSDENATPEVLAMNVGYEPADR